MVLEGIFLEKMGPFHHIMRKIGPMLPYLNDRFSMSPTSSKIPELFYFPLFLAQPSFAWLPTHLPHTFEKKNIALTLF
jgi:hypothetical protein